MAASNNNPESSNFKKYGVPFYSVAWLPYNPKPDHDRSFIVLAGGGGEGRSGIPNAVIVSEFDRDANTLSDQPVVKHGTGSDLPYRMAVHPGGHGLVCAFPKNCRWFECEVDESSEDHNLGLKQSEKELTSLEDVEQLALAFNNDGSILATGGEDGTLKAFKWPTMETILDEAQAHASVKGCDFSPDGKFLVSLGSVGCKVWDLSSSKAVASLPKANDEKFCACGFSQINDKDTLLYTAAATDKGGSIITWNTTTWKRIRSKAVVRDAITAFDVSADGKFLSCGTTQGDVWIFSSANMRIHQVIKKAHLGFVTALRFSRDSRTLASASMDASVRVTILNEAKNDRELNLWIVILILLIAIAAYFLNSPESLKTLQESLSSMTNHIYGS